jgi:hypothetical protein
MSVLAIANGRCLLPQAVVYPGPFPLYNGAAPGCPAGVLRARAALAAIGSHTPLHRTAHR